MPGSSAFFPDCSLQSLRVGELPRGHRAVFLREAARACGRYLRAGGDLGRIQEDRAHFRDGRLLLLPLPPGSAPRYPVRPDAVTLGLRMLEERWGALPQSDTERLRFVITLFKQLDLSPALRRAWLRNWLRGLKKETAREARCRYRALLADGQTERGPPRLWGCWRGARAVSPATLLRELEACRDQRETALHISPRAEVWRCNLLGEDAVVKYFPPPPSGWRQYFAPTRARRAWAGGTLLREQGLPGPEPLGFVEVIRNGCARECYFVMRMLPDTRTLRRRLIRHWPALTADEQRRLRHRLRRMILDLHRNGLYHKDLKLLNLLVDAHSAPGDMLPGWWIDLEDLRASAAPPFWMLIRNFYQLNSSIPSTVSREDRLAFARGFPDRHPPAVRNWMLRHVETKTRKRLEREVRARKSRP